MKPQPLSYAHIMAITDLWRDMGGTLKVEIGALEPLLWRDEQYRIHDVVRTLTERGFKVSMTTNGQLLDIFAKNLSHAGLSLIRTSWHSTDPSMFKEISGGYGDYDRFMRGIALALESNIKIAFNRVLLKGYTDDILKQILFIEQNRSRLKLYTLLWTPQSALLHKLLYQDWRSVVRESILPRTIKIERVKKRLGRHRLCFHLAGGGSVEVKLGDKLVRNSYPCGSCQFKNECEEGFGDYIRFDPSLRLYFCYMRKDIGFRVSEYFGRPAELKQKIQKMLTPLDIEKVLTTTVLRITITPFCNFNCRVPGTQQSWCMEKCDDYAYPNIRITSKTKK